MAVSVAELELLQCDHRLKMKGLREEVSERNRSYGVARCKKGFQIPCQGRRVAGDINHRGRGDNGQGSRDLRTEPGSRRVEDDQVRNFGCRVALQKRECIRSDTA